jgi:UDP-3-O-[3-hydroxymyristoyl] N-acetylglucosamine deacetylase
MQDRSAWELAHGYDEVAEPELVAASLQPVHA